jgi:hypothetical protein
MPYEGGKVVGNENIGSRTFCSAGFNVIRELRSEEKNESWPTDKRGLKLADLLTCFDMLPLRLRKWTSPWL